MIFIRIIGFEGIFNQPLQFVKSKAVDFRHDFVGNFIDRRVKVVQIAQNKSTGVANPPVSIA